MDSHNQKKISLSDIPSEILLEIFSILASDAHLPYISPNQPVTWPKWPKDDEDAIESDPDGTPLDATTAQGDPGVKEQQPSVCAEPLKVPRAVCKLWRDLISSTFRPSAADTRIGFQKGLIFQQSTLHESSRPQILSIHVFGDSCEGQKVNLINMVNLLQQHSNSLQFLHVSSHTFFHTEHEKAHDRFPEDHRDSFKAAAYNSTQWILNLCPNLLHLEIGFFTPSALDWWAIGAWPTPGTLNKLQHSRLETLALITPVTVDPDEHAKVEAEREEADGWTFEERRFIDSAFFAPFDRSGLPKLHSIIVLQHGYGYHADPHELRAWYKDLQSKDLNMGFAVVDNFDNRATSYEVYWVNGEETDEEWEKTTTRLGEGIHVQDHSEFLESLLDDSDQLIGESSDSSDSVFSSHESV